MRDKCASCRILNDPVLFDTCYWWMCFHQPCVAVHVVESTCVAHWRSASYEFLSRFYYVRIDSHSILVTLKILQSMSWWIFYVGIPYNTWRRRTWISEPSFVLSGHEPRWQQTVVADSGDWLSASRAILAGIQFPPISWLMTCVVVAAIATVAIAAATATAAAVSAANSTVFAAIATAFGWLLSALALPLLWPPLPALALAAVGCQHHCHCCRGRKPLPPTPSSATAWCTKYYI